MCRRVELCPADLMRGLCDNRMDVGEQFSARSIPECAVVGASAVHALTAVGWLCASRDANVEDDRCATESVRRDGGLSRDLERDRTGHKATNAEHTAYCRLVEYKRGAYEYGHRDFCTRFGWTAGHRCVSRADRFADPNDWDAASVGCRT